MLRPRRPRSANSSISLHDSCHSNTVTMVASLTTPAATRWSCPDVILIDDSQSASYSDSDDEEYAISEMKHPQHYGTEQREKEDIIIPLCRVSQNREKQNIRRVLLVRALMTLITLAAIAINYMISASNPATSNNTDLVQSRIPIAASTNESNVRIRKRRLVEIPISKMIQNAVPTTATTSTATVSRTIRPKTIQHKNVAAFVSIAQKAKIHRGAMKRLIDQYGMGPHLVEFQIRIWPENENQKNVGQQQQPTISYFTVEMAPAHMMPLSVHRFLQQISDESWDNTSFFMNAPHLIAAHPVSANSRISKPPHLFIPPTSTLTTQSSSLLYTEYNSAYPHLKYTLGFVGNGPEFYINKVMNPQHTDPCFANVVIGRNIVDNLFHIRGHDRTPGRIRPVEIITARIIQRNQLHSVAMEEYVRTTIQPKM